MKEHGPGLLFTRGELRRMKARDTINASAQSPANARLLKDALEHAWNKIVRTFGDDAEAADRARQRLAEILIVLPLSEQRTVDELADVALEKMAHERRPR
jgi:hypothetical protein